MAGVEGTATTFGQQLRVSRNVEVCTTLSSTSYYCCLTNVDITYCCGSVFLDSLPVDPLLVPDFVILSAIPMQIFVGSQKSGAPAELTLGDTFSTLPLDGVRGSFMAVVEATKTISGHWPHVTRNVVSTNLYQSSPIMFALYVFISYGFEATYAN